MKERLIVLMFSLVACYIFAEKGNNLITSPSDRPAFPSECREFLQTGKTKLKKVFGNYNDRYIRSVDFSPDGKKILSGHGAYGKNMADLDKWYIKLWDVSENLGIFTFHGHTRPVNSVVFSPDGLSAASASTDGTIRVWNVVTGKEIKVLKKAQARYSLAWAVDYSPDGTKLLVGLSEKPSLKLLDANSGEEIKQFNTRWSIRNVVYSHDGKYALSIGYYDSPALWEIDSGKLIKSFKRQRGLWANLTSFKGAWTCGDLSPQTKYIAAGGSDGFIRIWKLESEKEVWSQKAHKDRVNAVIFSPDGRLVVSTGREGKVKLWDTDSGKIIDQIDLKTSNDHARALRFAPDGNTFIIGTARGVILQFSIST